MARARSARGELSRREAALRAEVKRLRDAEAGASGAVGAELRAWRYVAMAALRELRAQRRARA